MIMNNEELNTKLYEKMFAEQDTFRDWLLGQEPAAVLDHAYEYTMREDILMSLEYNDLTDAQAQALLSSKTPLEDVFHEFENQETDHMENILDCITGRANDVVQRKHEEILNTPIYNHSGAYAREHDELPVYRASNNANIACKEALEKAINGNYRDNSLDCKTALKQVTDDFGRDRVVYVLANTVRQKDWDGRIDHRNKEWAQTIPVAENPDGMGTDRNCYFVVDQAHTGLVDLLVTHVRKEMALEKEQPQKKPSVIDMLQKTAAASSQAKAAPKKLKEAEL